MLRLKSTPTFSHSSLSLRYLLFALRSPARRAQDPMLRLQSKFVHKPSFELRLALFFKETLIRHAHSGGVLCSPLVVYGWCITPSIRLVPTPPTANAYTTRSCFERLPARFGHIILSCGVQFRGRESLTAQYRYAQCELQDYEGFACCTVFQLFLVQ